MKQPHVVHSAVLLQDGNALVVGGDRKVALPYGKAHLFNPLTGKWRSTGPMSVPCGGLGAILLRDRKVLISGGLSHFGMLWQDLETCEAYDPAEGKFVEEYPMAAQRANFSLAMLPSGKVLAVGGDQ